MIPKEMINCLLTLNPVENLIWSVKTFQFFIEPLVILIGGIIFTIHHWKKSTPYFKISFLCWQVIFWGYTFWKIVQIQSSTSSTAGIGYFFILYFSIWLSCAVWFIVWLSGFLIAKICAFVSNYRKRKHGR